MNMNLQLAIDNNRFLKLPIDRSIVIFPLFLLTLLKIAAICCDLSYDRR